ncbi:MAG: GGDEF domain-containing protein, partial [Rhizobiales bacterium]|nr:GGDEF domain-containing protein [Hyphomicrobiales bacterium]
MTHSFTRLLRFDRPSDAIYVELVDSLFSLVPPMIFLAISVGVIGAAIFVRTGDWLVIGSTVAILAITAERILM